MFFGAGPHELASPVMMLGYRAAPRPDASGDWFERLMGFSEEVGYDATQGRLHEEGDELVSGVNGRRYGIGELTLPTLAQLRGRVNPAGRQRSSLGIVVGDVRALHCDAALQGALFQVASQFNLLEMVSEHITPEQGVSRYAYDPTQGPACAMAAGAATIYRNYCVPVGGGIGQTRERQLDALAELGAALSEAVGIPVSRLWRMQNGYALCGSEGLAAITALLNTASEDLLDTLRGHLAIGLHRDVEVTDMANGPRRGSRKRSAQPFRLPIRGRPGQLGIVRALGLRGRLRSDAAGRGRPGGLGRLQHGSAHPPGRRRLRQRRRLDRHRHRTRPGCRRIRRPRYPHRQPRPGQLRSPGNRRPMGMTTAPRRHQRSL